MLKLCRVAKVKVVFLTAWNEQFRGIYGTVIFHDTRRILDRNATCQDTWRVIECRVPDTSFATCQDKSRSGYVKCSVPREIRPLILNGTFWVNEPNYFILMLIFWERELDPRVVFTFVQGMRKDIIYIICVSLRFFTECVKISFTHLYASFRDCGKVSTHLHPTVRKIGRASCRERV